MSVRAGVCLDELYSFPMLHLQAGTLQHAGGGKWNQHQHYVPSSRKEHTCAFVAANLALSSSPSCCSSGRTSVASYMAVTLGSA